MRMYYEELRDRPRLLQSLTGLNPTEFEALLLSFSAAWERFKEDTFERKQRKRAPRAGRKAELDAIEDKLLFILVYFRKYPSQEVQGYSRALFRNRSIVSCPPDMLSDYRV